MEDLPIHPRIISALRRAKLRDYDSVLSLSPPDLERTAQLSASDVAALQSAVAHAILEGCKKHTVLELYKNPNLQPKKLSLGCQVLDTFLQGGFLNRGITEVAGHSASGKTQLCLQLCLTAQLPVGQGGLNAGALYVCTEDVFPNKRLMHMVSCIQAKLASSGGPSIQFTDQIYIEHAAELEDLWDCVQKKVPLLATRGRIKLLIIDSIAALFRTEFSIQETVQRAKQLTKFGAHLHHMNQKYDLHVVCVNQVSDVVDSHQGRCNRQVIPALGLSWENLVTTRLMLLRTSRTVSLQQTDSHSLNTVNANVRSMEVMFAPHLPNSLCYYVIDSEGVKGLS